MNMFSRAAALTPARPEEILRQVNPWFILLTCLLGLLANVAPASGLVLELRPDFLMLVILYWCIQEPRYMGVGVAWMLGLVMDVADATVFGQHALAYAVLAVRRRLLPPPRAALPVVAAGAAGRACCCSHARRSCCSSASSAARRCPPGRISDPPHRGCAVVAAAVGAAAVAAAAVAFAG